ncbi:hypothetical protein [Paenibacillus sp. GYB003]|uniref:hypothetical protein n=1 Tax=Paenibacillus sp. GYB003 TaxID=2994392 RepID=UPI002F96BA73
MSRFNRFFQRGRAQVLFYDLFSGREIKEFHSQRAAKGVIRSFEHSITKYGWSKGAAGTGYEHIYFVLHRNDHFTLQRKPVLVYKQSDNGQILRFVPEDLDHIELALKYGRAVGNATEALRDVYNRGKWVEPLTILRDLADEIPNLDLAAIDYVEPWTFFNQVLDAIARKVRSINYARAVLLLSEFVSKHKTVEQTITMLETLNEYAGPEQVNLDAANEFFDLGLDEFTCFRIRTGVCSLMLSENEFERFLESEASRQHDKSSVHYCRHMLTLMRNNGTPPVRAVRNLTCNHVSLTDGQHRSCISKTMNMTLPTELISQRTYCNSCAGKRKESKDNRFYLL